MRAIFPTVRGRSPTPRGTVCTAPLPRLNSPVRPICPNWHHIVDPVAHPQEAPPCSGSGVNRQAPSCRPECRRLIHHQTPPPPAARTSRSHGHQVVPVSEAGAWTVGLDDSLGAAVAVVGGTLVGGLGDFAVEVGLIEAARVVTVAAAVVVTVAVAVVVVVGVEELARVAVGGLDADVFGTVGGATLEAGGRVDVFEADGRDAVGGATLEAGGRVGSRVGVGGAGLDGRLTVGTATVGSSDLVGVGSPAPLPPEPHPAAATTVISSAATTATRMELPPQAPLRLQHYKACHGGLPMDPHASRRACEALLGLLNQLPGSSWCHGIKRQSGCYRPPAAAEASRPTSTSSARPIRVTRQTHGCRHQVHGHRNPCRSGRGFGWLGARRGGVDCCLQISASGSGGLVGGGQQRRGR